MRRTNPEPALHIHLFGEPHFVLGSQRYKLRAPERALALLAYVLLHRGPHLKRAQIAYALWPDDSELNARAKLRRQLYQLQRALPQRDEPWLIVDEYTLCWNGNAAIWLDVAAFESGTQDESQHESVVNLYVGDLLASLGDEWIVPLRDRLRTAYATVLEASIARACSRRDFAAASSFAQRLLAHDPWREDTVRQVMTIRSESGDRAGALQAFEEFQRRLREEIDVDPMPETRALRDAILNDRVCVRSQALPFVGRYAEMEQLGEHWNRAMRGCGHTVLIGGEAGIGKTWLALQLSRRAEMDGAQLLWGATSAPETIPYQSVSEALRSVLSAIMELPVPPVFTARLAQLLPELRASLPNLPMPDATDPDSQRVRLFEATALALEALSEARPLLIVLEDLHRASIATIAALEFVARRVARKPILIVGTYRAEEAQAEHRIRELRRLLQSERVLTHLAVAPLARNDVDELLGKLALPGNDREHLATQLHVLCNGNPLFVAQALRDIVDSGSSTVALGTLQGLVEARLGRLSPQTRKLAETAAAIGAAFNVEVLREVCGWSEDAVLDCLDELQARNLVREPLKGHHVDYSFTHDLIHGTIYESSPLETRRRHHRRVTRALERLFPTRRDELARELAHQYEAGGENEAAAACYLRAARAALALYADDEALDAIDRGLDATAEPRMRADLLFEREAIHAKRGDAAAGQADLAELESVINDLDDNELRCMLLNRRILFERRHSDVEPEVQHIEELLNLAQTMGSRRWRAVALQRRAARNVRLGYYDEAQTAIDEAISLFEQTNDQEQRIACYCLSIDLAAQQQHIEKIRATTDRLRSLSTHGDNRLMRAVLRSAGGAAISMHAYDEALGHYERLLDLSLTSADAWGEAEAHLGIACAGESLFRMPLVSEHLELARAAYVRLGDPHGQARVANNFGLHYMKRGMLEQARDELARGHRLATGAGYQRGAGLSLVNLCGVAFLGEDYAGAVSFAKQALKAFRAVRHQAFEAEALIILAQAECELGALSDAETHLQAAHLLARSLKNPAILMDLLGTRAQLLVRLGCVLEARNCADEALAIFRADAPFFQCPESILWPIVQVYHAAGEAQIAQQILAETIDLRARRAAGLSDEEARRRNLAFRWNREIDAAATRNEWPEWLHAKRRVASR
jgi:DNA-binding SARP family transcriptional activator